MIYMNESNIDDSLKKPLSILGKRYGYELSKSGRSLVFNPIEEKIVHIVASKDKIIVNAPNKAGFFRGIGKVVEKEMEGILEYEEQETIYFDMNGLMMDCSRNGVMNVSYGKEVIEQLAMMGHSVLMLYMEDVYAVEGEDYFGYLRGRYTKEELMELDDYADMFGIELIPCIQTLAHLNQFLQWDVIADAYLDIDDILLVGDENVNNFLDRIIGHLAKTFRSRRIHLGMDEAYHLGRGRFADRNGLHAKPEIMRQHLETLCSITRKYNLKPIIWDDMFFSHYSKANETEYKVPDGIDTMYWDYYTNKKADYITNIRKRSKITEHMMFAGGSWKWIGFVPRPSKTFITTNAALNACKEEGIREVMVTGWADDGCECPISACLFGAVLFGEHGYQTEVTLDEFKRRLQFITGKSYEAYMKEEEFDVLPEFTYKATVVTTSKNLFYEDPLCSLFVYHTEDLPESTTSHYEMLSQYFNELANKEKNPIHKVTFEFYDTFARVMALKWNLGKNIYEAYQHKDKEELKSIIKRQLIPLMEYVEDMRVHRSKEWHLTNKSLGFEVLDMRFGSVKQRLSSAKVRLEEYLQGQCDRIDELEEVRLPVSNYNEESTGRTIHYNRALRSGTAGRTTW